MTIRMKFSETDRIVIQGVPFRVAGHHDTGIMLVQHENPLLTQKFTYEELNNLLKASSAVYQRGYFEWSPRRQALNNEVSMIGDLLEKIREETLERHLWCTETHALCQRGEIKLTRDGMAAAYTQISAKVHEQTLKAQIGKNGSRAGKKLEIRTPPKPSTVLEWYRAYREAGYSILGLIPGTHKSGNRSKRFCVATEAFVANSIQDYAHPLRPTKAQMAKRTQHRIREENRRRELRGEKPLAVVSLKTLQRRLNSLDPYYVTAQRYGLQAANRAYAIVENGEPALYPMEQIEMDSWKIDLIGLLAQSGMVDQLDAKNLSKMEKGRRWASVAIDKATRCVLACRITEKPSAWEAVRTLEEVTRDKSDIAVAMGCESAWPYYGGITTVITDQGSEYVSSEFRTAVTDLGGNIRFPPAGHPHLRGKSSGSFVLSGRNSCRFLWGAHFPTRQNEGIMMPNTGQL